MIVFQDEHDPILLAIVDEALAHVREVHRLHYREDPEAKDLRLTAVTGSGESEGGRESARRVPASGYVGPYPLRELGEEEDEWGR